MQRYHYRLTSVTGVAIVAQRSVKTYTGTLEELEAAYKKVLVHNLIFGWWSLFSLIWNPVALIQNKKNLQELHDFVAKQ